jgi:radical SAM superfamily enzyme YgiQ (UPF0313 family)
MKLQIHLSQVNNTYGKNAFLPYSVALLQAYAQTIPIIQDNYEFTGFVYLREPIENIIKRLDNPSVFGISCYIWNNTYSLALAKAVKEAFPKCLIVLGGPHVPNRSEGFFLTHSYADLLVHGEGEVTFADILLERITSQDYTNILGISVNQNGTTYKTASRSRVTDLDKLPSPYLAGVLEDFPFDEYDLHATQETHRGCPYSCTFCDWGSNTFAKVKQFGEERLNKEFEWFGQHRIEMAYNADANYGLFERDISLTKQMVEVKSKYGFPKKFRAAYAKNSNDRVFQIAKILNDADMNKGVTLSFQSMDDNTLEIIKRKNIKVKDFQNLMLKYRAENIPTYSEIIVGLPGETYDTFADGLDLLVSQGQHGSISVYTCEVLPNAELNDPAYRVKHGIRSVHVPVLFFHGTPAHDPHQECYELVTATSMLPEADWLRCQRISWAFQCFHCLGLTQRIAVFLSVGYRRFYEALLQFADDNPSTLIGEVTKYITSLFAGILEGREWGVIDQRFGDIIWPPEEGGFLKFVAEKERFYQEIKPFLNSFVSGDLLDDLLTYQKTILISPQVEKLDFSLNYNLHEYVEGVYVGQPVALTKEPSVYRVQNYKVYSDLPTYAREAVWYNRKTGKFTHELCHISQEHQIVH